MFPGTNKPSVIIDKFGEVEHLATATDFMHRQLTAEEVEALKTELPDFVGIMSAHARVLPLVREAGGIEPPQAAFALSDRQVAILSICLYATWKGHSDRFVRSASKEMKEELQANFGLSVDLQKQSPSDD